MRLDRFLANQGFGTRKEVKALLRSKAVTVDEEIIQDFAYQLDPKINVVAVEGITVEYQDKVYIMLYKPAGVICATQDETRSTVLDLINEYQRNLFPIGRLDLDTEGLLLLSNDGVFAHRIISGKKNIFKTYEVHLQTDFVEAYVEKIRRGLAYGDEVAKPAAIEIVEPRIIMLGISEGKYHQVKRMMQACNNEVSYLKRVAIGNLKLDECLKPGEYRYLNLEEVNSI